MKVGAKNPAGLQLTSQPSMFCLPASQINSQADPQARALLQYEPHLRLCKKKH